MATRPLCRVLPGSVVSSARASSSDDGAATAVDIGADGDPLSVCILSYRSNPYSGGQGVYVRHLSRELVRQGHSVDVISGKPYPDLDPEVGLIKLPGENVVDEEKRLRAFEPGYLTDSKKLFEWASVLTGGFPEPYTFGERVVEYFEENGCPYDVVHDNQSLSYGLLELLDRGVPTVATIHHPITVDREADLRSIDGLATRLLTRRWYRFLKMQKTVASQLPHVITVSEAAKRRSVEDFGVSPEAARVVHNGIDTDLFEPRPEVESHEKRIMTTVSADVPLKGTHHLLRAFAQVNSADPGTELVVIGEFDEGGTTDELTRELGIRDAISTHSEVSYDRMVDLYASSALAVVPSIYEGFGLPAGEAMACGVALVSTTGGALPEVVGTAGELVEPGDPDALADAVIALLADPERRERLGRRGRERIESEFDWTETVHETVREYRCAIAHADG